MLEYMVRIMNIEVTVVVVVVVSIAQALGCSPFVILFPSIILVGGSSVEIYNMSYIELSPSPIRILI